MFSSQYLSLTITRSQRYRLGFRLGFSYLLLRQFYTQLVFLLFKGFFINKFSFVSFVICSNFFSDEFAFLFENYCLQLRQAVGNTLYFLDNKISIFKKTAVKFAIKNILFVKTNVTFLFSSFFICISFLNFVLTQLTCDLQLKYFWSPVVCVLLPLLLSNDFGSVLAKKKNLNFFFEITFLEEKIRTHLTFYLLSLLTFFAKSFFLFLYAIVYLVCFKLST